MIWTLSAGDSNIRLQRYFATGSSVRRPKTANHKASKAFVIDLGSEAPIFATLCLTSSFSRGSASPLRAKRFAHARNPTASLPVFTAALAPDTKAETLGCAMALWKWIALHTSTNCTKPQWVLMIKALTRLLSKVLTNISSSLLSYSASVAQVRHKGQASRNKVACASTHLQKRSTKKIFNESTYLVANPPPIAQLHQRQGD